ncbi:MAG: polysaccharide deacetylase family protein [Limnochordia bacterium]|jgi:probable sporulation protein (polysaccharide deacetylase family)
MWSIVVTKRMQRRLGIILLVLLLWGFGPSLVDDIHRKLYGAKPGVTLGDLPVEGMLEPELYSFVSQLAKEMSMEPVDARYDPVTGRVEPEVVGYWIDVPATVEQILGAWPGAKVDFVRQELLPVISQDFFEPVYRGHPGKPYASLAINVDWGEEVLPRMLEVFREHNVVVTFFLTGRWAENNPEMAKALAEAGHEIGNHGLWHAHPNSLSAKQLEDLLVKNEDLLDRLTGQSNRLFAPPYGEFNDRVLAKAGSLGFRTIMWTLDTIDWQNPSPETIVERIVPKSENGAIVLMHPKENTLKALPEIIKGMKAKGLQLVPVGELLYHL